MGRVSQPVLVGSALTLAIGALLVVATLSIASSRQAQGALREPYPPFVMVYVVRNTPTEDSASSTVQLTWHGKRSWEAVVVDSTRSNSVGLVKTYDGVNLDIVSPVTGITTTLDDVGIGDRLDGSVLGGAVPGPWFVTRDFSPAEGWEAIGRDQNGYDQFRRTYNGGQSIMIYKRDPNTGVVMEAVEWDGRTFVSMMRAISFETLGAEE